MYPSLTKEELHTIVAVDFLLFSNKSYAERVYSFERYLTTLPQATIEPTHEFIDGLCKREIVFEEGMLATGKVHATAHMDVMLEGEMIVATEDGFKRLIAPCTMITKPGTKKAGIAIKRTRWISYHPTLATTREELEAEVVFDERKELWLS
tara:strand:+ start:9079 stop:9531 length:453 start_codon:yes stop_codon:yes gene_type:complete